MHVYDSQTRLFCFFFSFFFFSSLESSIALVLVAPFAAALRFVPVEPDLFLLHNMHLLLTLPHSHMLPPQRLSLHAQHLQVQYVFLDFPIFPEHGQGLLEPFACPLEALCLVHVLQPHSDFLSSVSLHIEVPQPLCLHRHVLFLFDEAGQKEQPQSSASHRHLLFVFNKTGQKELPQPSASHRQSLFLFVETGQKELPQSSASHRQSLFLFVEAGQKELPQSSASHRQWCFSFNETAQMTSATGRSQPDSIHSKNPMALPPTRSL